MCRLRPCESDESVPSKYKAKLPFRFGSVRSFYHLFYIFCLSFFSFFNFSAFSVLFFVYFGSVRSLYSLFNFYVFLLIFFQIFCLFCSFLCLFYFSFSSPLSSKVRTMLGPGSISSKPKTSLS